MEAFSDYLTNQNLDSRQKPPFTDQGSISEIFTDLSVWQEIRGIIEHINQNAIA